MKEWHPLKSVSVAVCCLSTGIGLTAFLISAANHAGDNHLKSVAEQLSKEKSYNLTHPEIVGTNENGEIVKRYIIPINEWSSHYVYEIGDTKTVNNNLGKAGLQVIVEKR